MSEVMQELDEVEIRLLDRICEQGITHSGMHLYTNVTAKERRLIRKFEKIKLVSIEQAWVKLTAAGQALVSAHQASLVPETPDDEMRAENRRMREALEPILQLMNEFDASDEANNERATLLDWLAKYNRMNDVSRLLYAAANAIGSEDCC